MDPHGLQFRTRMDHLNYFMRERRLPKEMREELREFLHQSRQVKRVEDDAGLLAMMSPGLQGSVAIQANNAWLEKIWYQPSMA